MSAKSAQLAKDSKEQPFLARAWFGDIGLILLGGLLLAGLVLANQQASSISPTWLLCTLPVRLILGLVYVLYVPGYLLQSSLFIQRDDLDGIERMGLSIGLSVALVPVLALVLDRLPWGIGTQPVIIAQGLLILLLGAAAAWRRLQFSSGEIYIPDVHLHLRGIWRSLKPADRRLYLLAASALAFAALAAGWVLLVPADAEFTTEFYLLGSGGLAQDYPLRVKPNQSSSITLGIHNQERAMHTYRVEAWAVDPWTDRRELVSSAPPVDLERESRLEWQQNFTMPMFAGNRQIEFLLFIDSQPEPYRRLVLWLEAAR